MRKRRLRKDAIKVDKPKDESLEEVTERLAEGLRAEQRYLTDSVARIKGEGGASTEDLQGSSVQRLLRVFEEKKGTTSKLYTEDEASEESEDLTSSFDEHDQSDENALLPPLPPSTVNVSPQFKGMEVSDKKAQKDGQNPVLVLFKKS